MQYKTLYEQSSGFNIVIEYLNDIDIEAMLEI